MFILKRKSAFFNEIQSIEKHASIATCYIGRLYSFLKDLRWRCDGKYKSEITQLTKWAKALVDVDVKSFSSSLEWKNYFENDCSEVFVNLRNRLAEIQDGMTKYSYEDPEYKKFRNEEFCIERILAVVSCLEFSRIENTMISCRTAHAL